MRTYGIAQGTDYSVVCGGLNGKEIWKRGDICICMADSLCCAVETQYCKPTIKWVKSLSRVWLFATPWTVKIIFFLFLTFLRFIFNWRIIALQCCAGFWCAMWISHKYTHIPLPPESPLQPLPPRHLGHHRAADWAPCDMQQVPTGNLLCTWQCLCPTATLSIHLIFF